MRSLTGTEIKAIKDQSIRLFRALEEIHDWVARLHDETGKRLSDRDRVAKADAIACAALRLIRPNDPPMGVAKYGIKRRVVRRDDATGDIKEVRDLDPSLLSLISSWHGTMSPSEVHAALHAGKAIYTNFCRWELEA